MACPGSIRGFSLYELLMTLLLIALVLTLGLPSFGTLAADQRLRTETDRLFHAVHLARKASVTRRRVVSLCPSSDGEFCSAGGDWSSGWLMFVNTDRDSPPVRDSGEAVLMAHKVGDQVDVNANRRGFTFRSTELRATNGTFVFCDRTGRASSRALVVSYTGRPRVTRTQRDGSAYACPD